MSSILYLFDEQFPYAVAVSLRRRGAGVLTANEASLHSAPDWAYLERCRKPNYVLVTQDRDFLRHDGDGVQHQRIVFCAHGTRSIGEMIEGLFLIYAVMSQDEIAGRVEFL